LVPGFAEGFFVPFSEVSLSEAKNFYRIFQTFLYCFIVFYVKIFCILSEFK